MDKFLKARRKSILIITILGVVGLLLIVSSVIYYANSEYRRTIRQVGRETAQITERSAEAVESYIASAYSHIQNAAIGISNVMVGDTIDNPKEVLAPYVENSPFADIEYIRADGMNMTNAGDPFDASDREYYKEGIKGNSGIWINYAPKYSEEPLLNFYAPIIYENRIVGVLTGNIGGNAAMKELLIDDYLGEPVYGIVVDENNTIIASTVEFEKGMVLDESTANVDESYKKVFLDAIARADGNAVELGGKYNNTLCLVREIKDVHWKIIQIVPSVSMHEITNAGEKSAIRVVEIIFLISIIFFAFVIYATQRLAKMNIHQVEHERDEQLKVVRAISDMFYTMHIVDLQTDAVTEYHAQGIVQEIIAKGEGATKAMEEVVYATTDEEFIGAALEFTDMTTIAERMKGKLFTYHDVLGTHVGWIRYYFIALERDLLQRPTKLILATQIVDEDKRREHELWQKMNSDELTGLLNRRAYVDRIQALEESNESEDIVYISMDVNGLKVVNDNLGHVAGDELIRGAATCMKQCFKKYGDAYRTGGDEFIAIIKASSEQLNEIRSDFDKTIAEWKGHLVDRIAVSCGYVEWNECPELSIIEVAKLADTRMYHAKALYYQSKGIDRRGLASAQTALLSLYKKILKINITEDTHTIVSMDVAEKVQSKGYSEKISVWFKEFAQSGNVHEDDREEFLAKTDLTYLRDYFSQNKASISIHYRRRMGDTYKNVIMEMIMADDYSPESQSLFLYVKEIDL